MLNCKNLISKAAPDELETGETGAENTKLFKVHSRLITRQDRETDFICKWRAGEEGQGLAGGMAPLPTQ